MKSLSLSADLFMSLSISLHKRNWFVGVCVWACVAFLWNICLFKTCFMNDQLSIMNILMGKGLGVMVGFALIGKEMSFTLRPVLWSRNDLEVERPQSQCCVLQGRHPPPSCGTLPAGSSWPDPPAWQCHQPFYSFCAWFPARQECQSSAMASEELGSQSHWARLGPVGSEGEG